MGEVKTSSPDMARLYDKTPVTVRRGDLERLAGMRCEHEIRHFASCDKADMVRRGCCNSCAARRIAERCLKAEVKMPGPFSTDDISEEEAIAKLGEAGGGLVERIFVRRRWHLVVTFKGDKGEVGRPLPVEESAPMLKSAVERAVDIVKLRVEKSERGT